jgi:hypothetical protein
MSAVHPLLTQCPAADAAPSAIVLDVAFESPTGGRRHALGGGASFGDAVEFARDSLPLGHDWRLVAWGDVYGE